jgi:hypothetical protein
MGVQLFFFGKGSQPFLGLVNKAAHVKITIGDITNSLNYCVAFYSICNLNMWLQGGHPPISRWTVHAVLSSSMK